MLLADIVRLAGDEELPQGVRLRMALDVLEQLADTRADREISVRTAQGLRFEAVDVGEDGTTRIQGEGDGTGAFALVWEVLAGRKADGDELPPLREVVDEIPADVSEIMERGGEAASTLAELIEKLEDAGKGYIDTHDDVRGAVAQALAGPAKRSEAPPASAAVPSPSATAVPIAAAVPSATAAAVPSATASPSVTAMAAIPAAVQQPPRAAGTAGTSGATVDTADLPPASAVPFASAMFADKSEIEPRLPTVRESDWPSFDDLDVPSFEHMARVAAAGAEGNDAVARGAFTPTALEMPPPPAEPKSVLPGRLVPADAPPAPPLPPRMTSVAKPAAVASDGHPTAEPAPAAAVAEAPQVEGLRAKRSRPEAPPATRVPVETPKVARTPIPPQPPPAKPTRDAPPPAKAEKASTGADHERGPESPPAGRVRASTKSEHAEFMAPRDEGPAELSTVPSVVIQSRVAHDDVEGTDVLFDDGEPPGRKRSARPAAEAPRTALVTARPRAEEPPLPPLPVRSSWGIVVTILLAALATLAVLFVLMTRAG